jgi:hypothetical protein
VREFAKATLSLLWAMSLFGVEQHTNILLPQPSTISQTQPTQGWSSFGTVR